MQTMFVDAELVKRYQEFNLPQKKRLAFANFQPPQFLKALAVRTGLTLTEKILFGMLVAEDGEKTACFRCNREFQPVWAAQLNHHQLKEEAVGAETRLVTADRVRELLTIEVGEEEARILPYLFSYPDPFAGVPVLSGKILITPQGPKFFCGGPWWGEPMSDRPGRFFYRPAERGCLTETLTLLREKNPGIRFYSYCRRTVEMGKKLQEQDLKKTKQELLELERQRERFEASMIFDLSSKKNH